MKNEGIPILNWDYLNRWMPKEGDWVLYSGIFTQWYGVVLSVEQNIVKLRYDGLMILLVQNTSEKIKEINFNKIKRSRGGKYIVIRNIPGNTMPLWFLA